MTSPLLLTEPEAAEALRICARTLRKARQGGKIKFVLIGRTVRYTLDDLGEFVAKARQDNPQQSQPKPKAQAKHSGNIVPFSELIR